MPGPLAFIIPAIASIVSAKMAGDAQQASATAAASGGAAGKGGGFDATTGTDKWANTIRALNEGKGPIQYEHVSPLDPEKTVLKPGTFDIENVALGKPSGNVMGQGSGAEGGGGEGDGGKFDMDNALQYAALAAQLGSMFAPPPPPQAPAPGRMQMNVQPYTLRMLGGR